MLYHILYSLHQYNSVFNVFRYLTFRTSLAVLTALLFSFLMGPWVIRKLTELKVGQYIRDDGPQTHLSKKGTPTMGGVLTLFSVLLSTLLWASLANAFIWAVLFVTVSFGVVGFMDDYAKLRHQNSKGLSGKKRLLIEAAAAFLAVSFVILVAGLDTTVTIPFFKKVYPDLGLVYIILATVVIVGSANAVNLTDGLDGLAIGPGIVAFATYLLFSYLAGNAKIAEYLQINYVKGIGEVSVFCGAMVGAGMGFLWYNTYPAQVFMGDTGALSLGSALGAVAVFTKQEILLVLVGGIFVIEALSVIFQVGFFKLTNGRRIFRMAPLHHHFELKGWAEPKVIVRFWIIAVILGLISLSTLKLR